MYLIASLDILQPQGQTTFPVILLVGTPLLCLALLDTDLWTLHFHFEGLAFLLLLLENHLLVFLELSNLGHKIFNLHLVTIVQTSELFLMLTFLQA